MHPIRHEHDLDSLRRAAYGYAVVTAWAECGHFDVLGDGENHSLAELEGDQRAIEITAPVLIHLGLLATDGEQWTLTTSAQQLLESGSLRLQPTASAIGSLGQLADVLRRGGPAQSPEGHSLSTEGGVRENDLEQTRTFIEMLYRRSEDSAQCTSRFLAPRLRAKAHILDLGGGHGRYGEALAQEGFDVTLFDRGVCVELARERYGDQLSYLEGNFLEDSLGGPYDAVLLSNIVHGLGREEILTVFHAVHEVLSPNGVMVIKDMFIDEHGAHPENSVFFGLTMLMYTREGRSYRIGEMAELCGEGGFAPETHHFDSGAQFSLLLARKIA